MARRDPQRDLRRWMRAADRGGARAAEEVVFALLSRRRSRANVELAKRYALVAIEHGRDACPDDVAGAFLYRDLAGGWLEPRAVGVAPELAIRWLRSLAGRGNSCAMSSLCLAYQRGAGVRRDWNEAEKWARRAARHGDSEALNNLGVGYFHGDGVRRHVARAAVLSSSHSGHAGRARVAQLVALLRQRRRRSPR